MNKLLQLCLLSFIIIISISLNAQVTGSMQWVALPNGMSGSCSSQFDCNTDVYCFGLEYTPGATGIITDYTTGFITECVGVGTPILSNTSCIMNDNSGAINACPDGVLFNSSGNTGSSSYNMGTAYIIHQVCFSLAPGEGISILEDAVTNLTTNIDLAGGGSVTDQPSYSTFNIVRDLYCMASDDIFVDESATGNNDGSSWTDAFTDLQDALAIATSGMNINIAEGTYLPTSSTSRGIFFDIPSGVSLLGGYPAGGGMRDPSSYTTSLSGEIDGEAGFSGNSFHVVRLQNATNVILDGLEITAGSADNANSFARSRGGGIYSNGSTVTLTNTTITGNNAIYGGGIFATLSPNVTFEACTLNLNISEYGSAVYHSNETNLFINNSYIVDNNSLTRCAVEINNSLFTEINNSIIANNASRNANAIGFIATNRDQSCNIYNSTILGETKNKYLLSLQTGNNDVLDLNIYNSVIAHQNVNFTKNAIAYNNGTLNFKTENCYIQGASIIGSTINNIYEDIVGDLMLNSNYSLQPCSPAVNTGNNNNINSLSTDFIGNMRIALGTVDIGAYENQTACNSNRLNTFSNIDLYPNPTSGILWIQGETENTEVSIYDMLGKNVFQSNSKRINISHLPSGIYMVNIQSNGKLLLTEKIIKQ